MSYAFFSQSLATFFLFIFTFFRIYQCVRLSLIFKSKKLNVFIFTHYTPVKVWMSNEIIKIYKNTLKCTYMHDCNYWGRVSPCISIHLIYRYSCIYIGTHFPKCKISSIFSVGVCDNWVEQLRYNDRLLHGLTCIFHPYASLWKESIRPIKSFDNTTVWFSYFQCGSLR